MSGLIPEDHISYILEKIDIVDVINSKIGLKKKGLNYLTCCPFHKEKTPSFSVNSVKQFYYCFGCGASGDVVKFIMDFDHLSFIEAITSLTHSLGLELPSTKESQPNNQLHELSRALELATKFFESNLRDKLIAGPAVNYLRQRQISGKSAKAYRLGLASASWDGLKKFLEQNKITEEIGLQAGLLSKSTTNGRIFDKFRERVMFTIRNKHGQVIGFGGRVLDAAHEPKYLNSPETPMFSKGHELYGLFEAMQAIRASKQIIVVEGYLDVISLSQHGIANCVATLGTSCTEFHLDKLFKISDEIVFCFDGDSAGRKAAIKALELALPLLRTARELKFLVLDSLEDPDSLVHKIGAENFKQKITQALSVFEFIKESSSWGTNPQSLDGKFALLARAKALILLLRDPLLVQMMLNQLAEEFGVEHHLVSNKPKPQDYKTKAQVSKTNPRSPVKKLLALIIKFPDFRMQLLPLDAEHLLNSEVKLLHSVVELLCQQPELSFTTIKAHLPAELAELFDVSELQRISSFIPDNGASHEFEGCLKLLQRLVKDQQVEVLLSKSRSQELSAADKLLLQKLLLEQ